MREESLSQESSLDLPHGSSRRETTLPDTSTPTGTGPRRGPRLHRLLVLPIAALLVAPPLVASAEDPQETEGVSLAAPAWSLPELSSSTPQTAAGASAAADEPALADGPSSWMAINALQAVQERFTAEEFEEEVPGWDADTGGTLSLPGGLELVHPVPFSFLSSPFGWRNNPTAPGRQFHYGQDYPSACGTPVRAAEGGVIESAGWHDAGGWRMVINHGHGVKTAYSHNELFVAEIGDVVQRGEVVAVSGTTGRSTGCHVHFEVIVGGEWVNPALYLPGFYDQPEYLHPGGYQGYVPDRGREDRDDLSAAGSLESPSASPSPSQSPTPRESESPSSSSSASPSASTSPSPQSPESTGSEQPTPSEPTSPSPSPSDPEPSSPEPSPGPDDESASPTPDPTSPGTETPEPEAPEPTTETPSSGSPSLDVCEVRDDAGELLEPDHPDYEELKELLPADCDD
ncbi:M23 family metallopeptidase [Nesterenkonia rhizosphaerae]|uniref:M23 family metallopeptidase n=1 Tax=Nesterenkonia rhizosphaerae TaxID=1348272 RepID=UPI0031EF66D4